MGRSGLGDRCPDGSPPSATRRNAGPHAGRESRSCNVERGERKDDIANKHRVRSKAREGVALIGVAEERAWSFKGSKRRGGRKRNAVFVALPGESRTVVRGLEQRSCNAEDSKG